MLRTVLAPNASPLTLQGTQTYILGSRHAVLIDPGPDSGEHLDACVEALGTGVLTAILLTHHHADHDAGAETLSRRTDAPVRSGVEGLRDGLEIPTDDGPLVAIYTPGHTPDHYSFWWAAERAIFCGDLMMGGLETALVAPPEGDLGAYLGSLERLRTLSPSRIYPAHGPAFEDPLEALDRYRRHRLDREAQVLAGLEVRPQSADALTEHVYGTGLAPGLKPYARAAIDAYLEHLKKNGKVRNGRMGWERTL